MRLENLVQYIVPLTFLAIWALTSLFNRDAQPLPPRQGDGRGPGPDGPRPSPRPTSSAMTDRRGEREPSAPPSRVAPGDSGGPRRLRSLDEGIVVVESDPRRSPTPSQGGSRTTARRGSRGRSSQGTASRQAETPVPRALSAEMSRSHAPLLDHPEALSKLAAPSGPLSIAETILSPTSTTQAQAVSLPRVDADGIRALVRSPERLREAFILAEVIQPPLSRRRPLPVRRSPR